MPTMRDMSSLVLSESQGEIVDHGAEVRARGKPLLEPLEERLPLLSGVDGGIAVSNSLGQPGSFAYDVVLQ